MFCALSCWLKWKKTKYFPRVEHRSPAIFTGGGHEFVSEIGLFRQLAGKDDDSDDTLEIFFVNNIFTAIKFVSLHGIG